VSKARSLIGSILLFGGLAVAQPAIAQALGDANCPGGYYFDPAHRVCVPYGYVYTPQDYSYDPGYGYGYAPPYYGQYYFFANRRDHDHDRDHDRDRRERHDRDRFDR
jgi:hypothetical protein